MKTKQLQLFTGETRPRAQALKYRPVKLRKKIQPFECDEQRWEIVKGREVRDYLMERTQENPYFAVVSAVMHAGPVRYHRQQRYVEDIVKDEPRHFLNPEQAREAVRGAELWENRAILLPRATSCYLRHCKKKECLKPKAREKLVNCLSKSGIKTIVAKGRRTGAGFGEKILDLTREYLGDPNAVAVDRHVARWACNNDLVCPAPKVYERIMSNKAAVPPKLYKEISQAIQRKARECNMAPSDLQVAAWIDGACEAQKSKPLYIGKGMSLKCIRKEPLNWWL